MGKRKQQPYVPALAMNRRRLLSLLSTCLLVLMAVLATLLGRNEVAADNYQVKYEAAGLMEAWMAKVKEYKLELGLPIDKEDLFETGMIGEEYTYITTTHGAEDAKRTTANGDMAALMVQMLMDAGMKAGDTIGAGFSGSFPSMNLAVLAACEAMDLDCVYIASVGASTYGANQPECTFPDMLICLHEAGLLKQMPVLVTPGGRNDCGEDMDENLREEILARIEAAGLPVMREADYAVNLQERMKLYEQEGPVHCWVGVGGNLTTTGPGEKDVPYGLIRPNTIRTVDENSGLVQQYNAMGLPVLHVLNIRKLVTDYGLEYDPVELPVRGTSQIYRQTAYPRWPALLALPLALIILFLGFRKETR